MTVLPTKLSAKTQEKVIVKMKAGGAMRQKKTIDCRGAS